MAKNKFMQATKGNVAATSSILPTGCPKVEEDGFIHRGPDSPGDDWTPIWINMSEVLRCSQAYKGIKDKSVQRCGLNVSVNQIVGEVEGVMDIVQDDEDEDKYEEVMHLRGKWALQFSGASLYFGVTPSGPLEVVEDAVRNQYLCGKGTDDIVAKTENEKQLDILAAAQTPAKP